MSRIALSATALLVTVALIGCMDQPAQAKAGPPQMPPAPVTLTEVIERPEAEWAESVGRLEAVDMVEVRPRVEGFIERIAVAEGSVVKPGDLLLEIDAKPFAAQVKRAEAQVADAKARMEQATKNAGRGKELAAAKAISSEEAENRASAVEVAKAAVQSAEAALVATQLELSYAKVTSPIAGRVGRNSLTVGNIAGPSRAAVTTVISYDPVYVTFDLDERTWIAARSLYQQNEQPDILVGFDGEVGNPHKAKLAFPDNRVDPATGTMRLRARMDNADSSLLPGSYVRVKLPISETAPRVLVDQRAILTDQNSKYVLVVDDGKAGYRPVTLGPMVGSMRIVKSGLSPGDPVILDIAKIFFPGAPVQVLEAAPAQAPAQPAEGAKQ